MLRRGQPSIRRVHAKNYIQQEADKRLQEVIKPAQQQGLNALGVDFHNVFLYLKGMSSTVCSCKEIAAATNLGRSNENVSFSGISQEHEIVMDWNRPLFGEPNEATFDEDTGTDDDYEFDGSEDSPHSNSIIEASPDCGICYRSGFNPGYEQYGQRRIVFTTHDIADHFMANVDRSVGPHVIHRLDASGWVEFELQVPKYFKHVSYSVRNNADILNEKLWTTSGVLDLNALRTNAGKTIRIRVKAQRFTHVVLTFNLGSEPIRANIAQLSKATDWTAFENIGNLNVILPNSVPELPVGSFIIVPDKNIGLRVTDVTYLRTSNSSNIDWSVNTRVAQPQELWKSIYKGFSLF